MKRLLLYLLFLLSGLSSFSQVIFKLPKSSPIKVSARSTSGGGGEEGEPNLDYQGYGVNAATGDHTSGGVITVSNQSEFNAALGSNRTILFDADVTITSNVYITTFHHLTIDGTGHVVVFDTNNGDDCISIESSGAHHIVLRNLHATDSGGDGINVVSGAHDVMIDRCSSWGNRDGNIDVNGADYVTVQYCVIGNGFESLADDGAGGSLDADAPHTSWHHNLWNVKTNNGEGERCPFIHGNFGDAFADVRYNTIYNYGRSNATGTGYGVGMGYGTTNFARANIVANYFYTPSTQADQDGIKLNIDGTSGAEAYSSGNVSGNGFNFNSGSQYTNSTEFEIEVQYEIATETACEARLYVLQYAGPDVRNAATQAFIDDVTVSTGCP